MLFDLSESSGVGVGVVPVEEVVVGVLSFGEFDFHVVVDSVVLVVFESVCLHALILSDGTASRQCREAVIFSPNQRRSFSLSAFQCIVSCHDILENGVGVDVSSDDDSGDEWSDHVICDYVSEFGDAVIDFVLIHFSVLLSVVVP